MSFRRLTKCMFFGDPSLSRLPLTLSPNSSPLAQSFSVSLVPRTSRRPLDTSAHSHSLELPSSAALRLLTFNFRPLTVPFPKRRKMNTYTKSASNSRRISTSNLLDLNLGRMNTYENGPRGATATNVILAANVYPQDELRGLTGGGERRTFCRCCGDQKMTMRTWAASAAFYSLLILGAIAATGAAALAPSASASAKDKPLSWKPIENALLRVNDAPPKEWGVYRSGKKNEPLLLQIGNRFLLIDTHDRHVFELDPAKIERKTGELDRKS